MLPRVDVCAMRACPLLLFVALLAATPSALGQGEPAETGYPMGISVVGGPEIRAPVGETTAVRVQLSNADPTRDRTFRVGVTEFMHLTEGAEAGEGLSARNEEDVVTVPAGGEAYWILELMPKGEGSTWRVTIGWTEDVTAPTHPVTSFTVDTRPTLWSQASGLVVAGGAGALGAGVGALLVWRPGLRGALALPFVGLYTRLRRSDALSNANRERVYELIRARPGVGYAELMRETGLGAGVLVHHLRILEREQLVASRRYGLRRRLFPAGQGDDAAPTSLAQERVLAELRSAALTQAELRERLALSQQGVSYHIQRLQREGRIQEERVGPERRWRAVDRTGGTHG